jgi:phage-related holin
MLVAKITFKLLFIVVLFDTVKLIFMPNLTLLLWVCVLMVADIITGLLKSKLLKERITSDKLRASIIKFLQYFGCIGLTIVIMNQKIENPLVTDAMKWAQDGLTILIIYIECLSIFENLYAMDQKNPFAVYVIRPIYFILSLAVKSNPLAQMEKKQKRDNHVPNKNDVLQDENTRNG